MRELLAGHATKSDAVESTQAISGALLLSPKGAVLPGSKLELELSALSSDRDRRDNFIKRSVLETSRYPNVEFVPKQAQGLDGLPPASGQVTFKLLGDATVHGVTKPMTWDVTAQCSGQGCNGTATSSFTLTEFGMTPPRIGPVLEVEDQGRLELRFQAARSVA
ncbi:MAG: YceI family protein [Chloroflexota bacterium]|nr:YceI family protein [Chloroflexota bacterium]